MSSLSATARAGLRSPEALFVAVVFLSAGLVFLVEPIAGKLLLPLLGGGPAVWNTSLAFFQIALLAGYSYAHLLQRAPSLKAQALIHLLVLAVAATALPLQVRAPFGMPDPEHPVLWLLGALALSIGAPFAALSATAPLVQAWRARIAGGEGETPYALYAASNLGSLLALLAYPALVEPTLTLRAQRLGWSLGYGVFVAAIAALAAAALRAPPSPVHAARSSTPRPSWRARAAWLALSALPASLMLGVTSYITTDVASAPFLWVLPLALYLLSFILAFQARPRIAPTAVLGAQALAAAACIALAPFNAVPFFVQLPLQLAGFVLTALMCNQALVARRPDAAQLTEFYFWISLGGVLGGGFNAFVAPAVFNQVWEYPLALALAALVRPWGEGRTPPQAWVMLGLAVIAGPAAAITVTFRNHLHAPSAVGAVDVMELVTFALLAASAIASFLVRRDGLLFCAALAAVALGANGAAERAATVQTWRSFFGVLTQSQAYSHGLGGPVRLLSHGTTLHGAEAVNPRFRCEPLVYYTPATPIGQVVRRLQSERPALRIGVVGLGAGAMAAYVRAADRLTFYEIDPLVARVATDPRHFRYISDCAGAPVRIVLGDARLTLAREPAEAFDVLLIDAFSSDAVPTHLLTVEALRGYLTHLRPDGVMILHLSNRNLDLKGPAQAVAIAAGGRALLQEHRVVRGQGSGWESDEDALIVGRTPAALVPFAADPRWRLADPNAARPWTDDYVNLPGALWRKLRQRYGG